MTDETYARFVEKLSSFVNQQIKILVGLLVVLVVTEIFLLSIHQTVSAQIWTTYSPLGKEGIVRDIAVDHDNNIWMVYLNQSEVFPLEGDSIHIPLVKNDELTALAIDPSNQFWVGTGWGMVYKKGTDDNWTIFEADKELSQYNRFDHVANISIDQEGHAWIGTNEGVWIVDTNDEILYPFGGLFRKSGVTTDSQGEIQVFTAGELMAQSDNGDWLPTGEHPGRKIAVDNDGRVWGGYSNQIYYHTEDNGLAYKKLISSNADMTINVIIFDEQNRIWVGSNQGVFRIDPDNEVTQFNAMNSNFQGTWAYDIETDQTGKIWITTDKGIAMYNDVPTSPIPGSQILRTIRGKYLPSVLVCLGLLILSPFILSRVEPILNRPQFFHYFIVGAAAALITYVPASYFKNTTLDLEKPFILYFVPTVGALLMTYFRGVKKGIITAVILGLLLHLYEIINFIIFIFIFSALGY